MWKERRKENNKRRQERRRITQMNKAKRNRIEMKSTDYKQEIRLGNKKETNNLTNKQRTKWSKRGMGKNERR